MLYGCVCWMGTKDLEEQMLTQSNGALFVLKPVFHFSDALLLSPVSPGSHMLPQSPAWPCWNFFAEPSPLLSAPSPVRRPKDPSLAAA